MHLLHVVAFSKKLRRLAQTKVITLKTQLHAVNARQTRLSQLSLSLTFTFETKANVNDTDIDLLKQTMIKLAYINLILKSLNYSDLHY